MRSVVEIVMARTAISIASATASQKPSDAKEEAKKDEQATARTSSDEKVLTAVSISYKNVDKLDQLCLIVPGQGSGMAKVLEDQARLNKI